MVPPPRIRAQIQAEQGRAMSKTVTVRYRTRPEAAEENVRLLEGVYAALARLRPGDFRYSTLRLADGVSFLHIAHIDGEGNPLISLPEFAEFQRELAQRCVEPPTPSEAVLIGAYPPS
jgi:hypothetical protein